jgi:hypothetical protein
MRSRVDLRRLKSPGDSHEVNYTDTDSKTYQRACPGPKPEARDRLDEAARHRDVRVTYPAWLRHF